MDHYSCVFPLPILPSISVAQQVLQLFSMSGILLIVLSVYALIRRTTASPYPGSSGTSGTHHGACVEFMLPVAVTAQNADYGILPVNDNIDAVQFAVDSDTWSAPPPIERIIRNITVDDTFQISAYLCVPEHGNKKNYLQIATHGLIFDKRYWDVAINPAEYSYVKAAMDAGYSILTYDRLSTGKYVKLVEGFSKTLKPMNPFPSAMASSEAHFLSETFADSPTPLSRSEKPDAYTVAQAPVELEILRAITEMSRNGELLKRTKASYGALHFDKIIHVGHSFGSFLTAALLATYGTLSDAAVLTGYILANNTSPTSATGFAFQFAPENDPSRFGDLPSGYIVPDTASAVQTEFFSSKRDHKAGIGGFKPELLEYANNTKQPGTVGEFTSLTTLNFGPAPQFTGAVQFMAAEYDFPVCGGDCRDYDLDLINLIYGNASDIDVYLQPGTGHGLTMVSILADNPPLRQIALGWPHFRDTLWLHANISQAPWCQRGLPGYISLVGKERALKNVARMRYNVAVCNEGDLVEIVDERNLRTQDIL